MIFYCGLSNFRLELIGIGIIGGLLSQEVVKVGKLLPELWIKNGDLKEACSVSGLERVQELKKIVITFEEKIYSAAKSQDYDPSNVYTSEIARQSRHKENV
ncbi:uncharacterized protein LOC114076796 isoform X2 [Solanum pennellii]|uniref:Uncharacterized protein LOC114076796 isoform X2 n=1 Tax=Solanum pennellii TaxID=28526 RepID=A0ABM1V8P0_SOLPN|nr:uncharacterized protein LOC114076796 isoform X2 [Solanum pennellii]